MMYKTVFILGAGFSKPAQAPIQSEIIKEILKLDDGFYGDKDELIKRYLVEFKDFLKKELYIDEGGFENVALEDIFTPIDRCLLDGISFRSLDVKALVDIREKIYSLIIVAIKNKLSNIYEEKKYIDDFGSYLAQQMKPRMNNPSHDPVSVISTNWDILLDNSIKRAIENDAHNGVVDYCCYINSLENDETITPGLLALGRGKYNVKLLKMHGSMNWLHCPKCQRLFVAFYEKIAEYGIYRNKTCKYCPSNFPESRESSAILKSNLIMPTFLKDLNNFQIKLIWQNAGVELSESSKVVFIGYSLPQADYELRQLLSRMIPHHAIIEVVMQDAATSKISKSNEEILKRYKDFFGKRKVVPFPIGVERYISEFCQLRLV